MMLAVGEGHLNSCCVVVCAPGLSMGRPLSPRMAAVLTVRTAVRRIVSLSLPSRTSSILRPTATVRAYQTSSGMCKKVSSLYSFPSHCVHLSPHYITSCLSLVLLCSITAYLFVCVCLSTCLSVCVSVCLSVIRSADTETAHAGT